MTEPPLRVLVVGGGAAGLLHAQLLLDRAADTGRQVALTWAVWREGAATASRSGGLALRYASPDPRAADWAARSPVVGAALAARHAHLTGHVRTGRALLVSQRAPVVAFSGDVVEPAAYGLPHTHGLLHEAGPLWHTCGLLPRWAAALAEDPRVRRVDLDRPVRSTADLLRLHDEAAADVTVACLGLGAHALGDPALEGRLGVLVTGPLPAGLHRDHAVVDDDDPLRPRYTVPHGGSPATPDHLHVGGTYLPVTDPADWDEPSRLRERALAEVPALLADARARFPDLRDWEPDPDGVWWGLRPVRPEVAVGRLDPAGTGGRTVVVDHGWGGSGWTIGPALADEVATGVLTDRAEGLPVVAR
ncbi:FAD-dependent oxidoreductase [Aquipuribacter nitratireducens]|uniref:D-amino-acid oxidase n=1 Tax=Aquipuribacter nitratireducens TaxID=650104 RepID=A0ABW0GNX9_9MICO